MSKTDLFVHYLEEIGLIEQSDSATFASKLKDANEDKEIVFELTNYIQQLSASSQYDLSSRVYQYWVQHKYESAISSHGRNGYHAIDSNDGGITSVGRVSASKSRKSTPETAKGHKRSFTASGGLQNGKKTTVPTKNRPLSSKNPQTERDSRCITEPGEAKNKNGVNKRLSGGMQSPDQASAQRSTSAKQRYEQLYGHRIIHEHNRMLRKEMSEQKLLKECTFSPRINEHRLSAKSASETPKTSVFNRLSKTKTPRGELLASSRENREMEGATFQPDLSKSNKVPKTARDSSAQGPAKASERLYQDAHFKQKVLRMKAELIKDKELEDCTFKPQLFSSPISKDHSRKNSDTTERLYLDSLRRNNAQKYYEMTRNADDPECTFHPRRVTMDHGLKSKDKKPESDTDIFTRLYQSARKRQELEKEFEEEIIAMDTKRLQHIHAEASPNLTRKASLQHEKILKENTTSTLKFDDHSEKPSIILKKEDTRAFDRLYDESNQRKQKLSLLEQKVMKERGMTFAPMTTRTKSSLQSAHQKSPSTSANKENSNLLVDDQQNGFPDSVNIEQLKEIRTRYHHLRSSSNEQKYYQ
mgnify:FL=1